MGKRKNLIRVVALAAVALVLVSTILEQMPEAAFAQQSFNGIDTVISAHGEDDPFTIVELVPDAGAAKLGYLVEGSEPFYYDAASGEYQTYTEHLAALTSASDRTSFDSSMVKTLSAITGDEDFPLSYTAYAESYAKKDGYTALALDEAETITSGTSGYSMNDVGTGQGDFSYTTSYEAVTSGGSLEQNISYYDVNADNKYYNLTFTKIDDISNYTGAAYKVSSATSYSSYDEAVAASANNVYYSEDSGTTFVKAETNESKSYYVVYFTYAENPGASDGVTYYAPSLASFDITGSATYGAVLDETTPYVNASGNGHFNSVGASYQYVGDGNGAYELTEGGTLDADVTVSYIYYKGGFTNNEIFKEYVFNQSGLLNEEGADICIEVIPMTPEEFNSYDGSMDLLYISNSSALSGGSISAYGTDNDIAALLAYDIYSRVVSEDTYLPVILDYSILEEDNTTISDTNIYKLATLLTAEELSADHASLTTNADNTFSITIAGGITAFSDSDHHYVNENIYVIPGDSGSATYISDFAYVFLNDSNEDEDVFLEDAEGIGFGDVADTIVLENLYREVENAAGTGTTYEMFDQMISKAIAVEYIISYATKRAEYENYDIQVLDIEPCLVNSDTQEEIEENIKKYLGITSDSMYTVTVTHMTSAEFISKVEDLCNYDMIYMGLYTDTINTTSDGRTVYNDADMAGLVYCSIGDYRYDQYAVGLLDTDFKNTSDHYSIYNKDGSTETQYYLNNYGEYQYVRYSGNDFTDEKVEAIENFVKSGLPVILANNFLYTASDGTTYVYDYEYDGDGNALATNGNGYIDNCSKVYELIDAIKDSSNVMTESAVASSTSMQKILFQYITIGKPVLTVTTDAKESGEAYVNADGTTVSFDFSIANFGSADTNATFNCMLYADFNADGRYSGSTELINATDFTLTLNGVKQTVKSKTDDEGNSYYYYELSPNSSGTTYHLEYTLSDDYVGVIPIKIKVSQSGNDYRYDSDEMYFYISNTTGEKLTIRVLQILPTTSTSSSYSTNVFNMGDKGVYDGTLTESSTFYQYLHNLEDYDIQIDAMYAESTYVEAYENDPTFLDNYDMLVLGFADCYVFINAGLDYNNEVLAAYQGVRDFIDSGKSVLFTHDTTSYGNNPTAWQGSWAFDMNLLLPQDVGLDRYGINTSYLLQAGLNLDKNDTSTTYFVSEYQSLKKALEEGILTEDSYTSAELFELVVAESTENSKDIAYKPNSGKTKLINSVQGRSNLTIDADANDGAAYYSAKGITGGLTATTQVEMINEGQILVYPYNILDEITANDGIMTVAATHRQYYQIDMNEDADEDGESDITVWLSLTGDGYSTTNKDARNNYYIYTKGNVTYSGVGHTNIDFSTNTSEIKLYINTMVAAYQAGAHAPTITVKDGADSDASDLNTIYVGFDSTIDDSGVVSEGTQVDSGSETVYFTVSDTNTARGGTKQISVNYYLVYGDESDLPDGVYASGSDIVNLGTDDTPVYAKELDYTTHKTSGAVQDSENLTSGATYSVEIPYDIIDEVDDSKARIWITATTSIWNANADASASASGTYTSHKEIYVQRIGLFDLD